MSGQQPEELPSEQELANMSRAELVTLGNKLDGVELLSHDDPWPVKGTKAEKRAERAVTAWFVLAAVLGLAFFVVFIWWPWKYADPGHQVWYSLYTPLIGFTFGGSITALGVGALMYTKRFVPHELAIQQRHDGPSTPVDQATIVAEFHDAGHRSTIARRPLLRRTAFTGLGLAGAGIVALPIGGLIRNPWNKSLPKVDQLAHTGWYEPAGGEKVFLRVDTGDAHEVRLLNPADMDAGGMQTVFPFRESERGDTEKLQAALTKSDNPVMIIRLRPQDSQRVIKAAGKEDYNYGDYYAYTKICSHLGCPTSLYEQQTNRILCPCHQSQFDALEYAKPIFGPAARALAQLPITVDPDTGYLISLHDFDEPVGPAYWERTP
jgi:ubiquinol-cytochrome c reductase iron-sulfur subunit